MKDHSKSLTARIYIDTTLKHNDTLKAFSQTLRFSRNEAKQQHMGTQLNNTTVRVNAFFHKAKQIALNTLSDLSYALYHYKKKNFFIMIEFSSFASSFKLKKKDKF